MAIATPEKGATPPRPSRRRLTRLHPAFRAAQVRSGEQCVQCPRPLFPTLCASKIPHREASDSGLQWPRTPCGPGCTPAIPVARINKRVEKARSSLHRGLTSRSSFATTYCWKTCHTAVTWARAAAAPAMPSRLRYYFLTLNQNTLSSALNTKTGPPGARARKRPPNKPRPRAPARSFL